MYDRSRRSQALTLVAAGRSLRSISRELGVSRAALREWAADPDRALADRTHERCFVCRHEPCRDPVTYAYLLGEYLGDGYLVTTSRVPRLRIACADAYPGIAAEVDAAMEIISGNRPGAVQNLGCTDRYSFWKHWPCLFPQHGPGRKHERPIVLARWQQALVAEHPWPLIRGLIHSDGCRSINRVVVRGKTYRYPRYLFANESRDILIVIGDALDRVGVAWRYNRPNSISVARRDAVSIMDVHVGPKR